MASFSASLFGDGPGAGPATPAQPAQTPALVTSQLGMTSSTPGASGSRRQRITVGIRVRPAIEKEAHDVSPSERPALDAFPRQQAKAGDEFAPTGAVAEMGRVSVYLEKDAITGQRKDFLFDHVFPPAATQHTGTSIFSPSSIARCPPALYPQAATLDGSTPNRACPSPATKATAAAASSSWAGEGDGGRGEGRW